MGIVTTTRLTHATPAAAYAHVPNRNWEGDANLGAAGAGCKDIALQLIEDNPDIQVQPHYLVASSSRIFALFLVAHWHGFLSSIGTVSCRLLKRILVVP